MRAGQIQMMLTKSTFSIPLRYFFNLTNGREVIPDIDGIKLRDIDAVMVYVFEIIDQVKSQPDASREDWLGWRLEIADASGRRVHSVPLDNRADWFGSPGELPRTLVLHS
jgi:hypothetical protein